jgi:hypothetical protein
MPFIEGVPLPANNMRIVGEPIPFDSSSKSTRTASMQASPVPSRPRSQQHGLNNYGAGMPWNNPVNQFTTSRGVDLHFDDSSVAWEQMRPVNDDSSIESTPSLLINRPSRRNMRLQDRQQYIQEDITPSRARHSSHQQPHQRLRYNLAGNADFEDEFAPPSLLSQYAPPPIPGQFQQPYAIPNMSDYSPDMMRQRVLSSQASVRSVVSESKSLATVQSKVGSRTRPRRISKSYIDVNYHGATTISSARNDDDAQSHDNRSHVSELSASVVTMDASVNSLSQPYQYRKYAGRRRNRLRLQGQERSSADDNRNAMGRDPNAGPGGKSQSEIADNHERIRQSHELLHWRTDKPLPEVDIFSGGNSVFSTRESVYSASVAAASSIMSMGSELGPSPIRKKAAQLGPGSILYSEENDDDPIRTAMAGRSIRGDASVTSESLASSGLPMFTWN